MYSNNFDYVKNFDPIGNNIDKTYSLSFDGVNREIINLQSYSAQTLPLPGVVIGIFTATTTTVQGGFYPKLINDCNMFLNLILYNSILFSEFKLQKAFDSMS